MLLPNSDHCCMHAEGGEQDVINQHDIPQNIDLSTTDSNDFAFPSTSSVTSSFAADQPRLPNDAQRRTSSPCLLINFDITTVTTRYGGTADARPTTTLPSSLVALPASTLITDADSAFNIDSPNDDFTGVKSDQGVVRDSQRVGDKSDIDPPPQVGSAPGLSESLQGAGAVFSTLSRECGVPSNSSVSTNNSVVSTLDADIRVDDRDNLVPPDEECFRGTWDTLSHYDILTKSRVEKMKLGAMMTKPDSKDKFIRGLGTTNVPVFGRLKMTIQIRGCEGFYRPHWYVVDDMYAGGSFDCLLGLPTIERLKAKSIQAVLFAVAAFPDTSPPAHSVATIDGRLDRDASGKERNTSSDATDALCND